jgi:bifunctional non-homologous end joining protein LigD
MTSKESYVKGHLSPSCTAKRWRWHLRHGGKPREKRENWLLIKGEDKFARSPG